MITRNDNKKNNKENLNKKGKNNYSTKHQRKSKNIKCNIKLIT